MPTFSNLGISGAFLTTLKEIGYDTPTPIQEQAIPQALAGKDIFGCAQTGTGKTAAFMLPTLQRLHDTHDDSDGKKTSRIRAVILTPTRELAIQIGDATRDFTKRSNLRHTTIYGGVSEKPQIKKLRQGVEIVIATPGRLLDLINQKHINLSFVETFILDEADRMLDMGFIHDIKKIINFLPKHKTNQRQTLFFSATFAPKVMDLARDFLTNPIKIEIAPESTTVDTVSQHLYMVDKDKKPQLLLHVLKRDSVGDTIVFTRTKHGANKLEKYLHKHGVKAAAIHGNKSQNARQNALKKLKSGEVTVLVATDVAARGIDVDKLSTVVVYDLPTEAESYVHRIGRTGRAGEKGQSFTFLSHEEISMLKAVQELIGQEITIDTNQPFHTSIDLNGSYPQWKPGGGRGGRSGRGGGRSGRTGGGRKIRSGGRK